jgi:hypothetical protein
VSQKLGRSITLDPKTGKTAGDDEVKKHLARPYRKGYKHPGA